MERRALLAAMLALATPARAGEGMALLADGAHLGIMRHAIAPGTGDPPGFRLDACETQRNLSEEGRAQARRIGDRLRAAGIGGARAFTSQWCRARDTAALLGFGPAEDLPALNSFFAERGAGPARTAALRAWIAAARLDRPLLLVSHQVNITALADVVPVPGEIVLLRRTGAGLAVAGRVPPG
jgi:phosphohistidine phosphatase SixA